MFFNYHKFYSGHRQEAESVGGTAPDTVKIFKMCSESTLELLAEIGCCCPVPHRLGTYSLALTSAPFICLSLPSAGIVGMSY